MKELRKNEAITLVALVVTIVVLLILVGITFAYILGDNSIFNQASQAKIQTELGKIEERAQVIYSNKLLETASSSLDTSIKTSDVIEQLKEEGYLIEKREVSTEDITGISLDKESITIGKNKTVEIKVTYEGIEDPFIYYVEVQGKYYKMHSNKGFITIDRKPSNLVKMDFEEEVIEGGKPNLTVISNDTSIVTTKIKEGSNNIIEITSLDKESETTVRVIYGNYEKICKVRVKEPVLATELEINSVRARIANGYTRWLTASVKPNDADNKELEWSSSDTSIAIVDNKGVVTAKKGGTARITVKTKDGSNLSKTCEITIVENTLNVETLTEIQTGEKNKIAKDSNGNLITIPIGFKVLTSEGTKITDGIVISDGENEFVWVPVDSVSTGTTKPADDIRLGRYEDFETKNANGNYTPTQDAVNYMSIRTIKVWFQELVNDSENISANNLGDFVTKTLANGGYYLARYEASKGSDNKVKSQYNKEVWVGMSQPVASSYCQNMYQGNSYVESDLINSYAWDTAIIFIQKYSENSNYAKKTSVNSFANKVNTGMAGDKVCNIHDMASNCLEWSTEHSINHNSGVHIPAVYRGPGVSFKGNEYNTSYRGYAYPTGSFLTGTSYTTSCRSLLYLK